MGFHFSFNCELCRIIISGCPYTPQSLSFDELWHPVRKRDWSRGAGCSWHLSSQLYSFRPRCFQDSRKLFNIFHLCCTFSDTRFFRSIKFIIQILVSNQWNINQRCCTLFSNADLCRNTQNLFWFVLLPFLLALFQSSKSVWNYK